MSASPEVHARPTPTARMLADRLVSGRARVLEARAENNLRRHRDALASFRRDRDAARAMIGTYQASAELILAALGDTWLRGPHRPHLTEATRRATAGRRHRAPAGELMRTSRGSQRCDRPAPPVAVDYRQHPHRSGGATRRHEHTARAGRRGAPDGPAIPAPEGKVSHGNKPPRVHRNAAPRHRLAGRWPRAAEPPDRRQHRLTPTNRPPSARRSPGSSAARPHLAHRGSTSMAVRRTNPVRATGNSTG